MDVVLDFAEAIGNFLGQLVEAAELWATLDAFHCGVEGLNGIDGIFHHIDFVLGKAVGLLILSGYQP